MSAPDLAGNFDNALGVDKSPCMTPFTGVATGYAKVIDRDFKAPHDTLTDDVDAEINSFWKAYEKTVRKFEDRLISSEGKASTEDAKLMIRTIRGLVRKKASDKDIKNRHSDKLPTPFRNALDDIKEKKHNAGYAVYVALQALHDDLNAAPGMEKTAQEALDIQRTFLHFFDPQNYPDHIHSLRRNDIPFYTDMSHGDVSDLVDSDNQLKVKACYVDHTTITSHAVLNAKSHALLIGWSPDGQRPKTVRDGVRVIIDGDAKKIVIDPPDKVWQAYKEKEQRYAKGYEALKKKWQKQRKAVSRDGRELKGYINGDTPASAKAVSEFGAQGMGLIRLEGYLASLPELERNLGVDQWYQYIDDTVKNADRATFVFRLLDFVADKAMPGFDEIKVALTDEKFITAFLKYRDDHKSKKLELMAPQILSGKQLAHKQLVIDTAADSLGVKSYKIGSMSEHPDFLDELETGKIDASFLSSGSNDMTAETLEINRFAEEDAERNDPTAPKALLNLERPILYQRDIGGPDVLPVSLCGDMASQPENYALLAGMGYRRLSMAAAMMPVIKELHRRIDTGYRFRTMRTDNPERYQIERKKAQKDDQPSNAWALYQRILIEESPQKRRKIITEYNEKYLGLDSHNRIDLNWKAPDDAPDPDAEVRPDAGRP